MPQPESRDALLIDALVIQLANTEEDLLDAWADAVTIRATARELLVQLFEERKLRKRAESRLKELLEMPDDDTGR
jgi:hypothetical protein